MNMQDKTAEHEGGFKRTHCDSCGTSSSSMWETHKLMLVCFEEDK